MILPLIAGIFLRPGYAEHLFVDGLLIGVRRNGNWQPVGERNGPLAGHNFHQIGFGEKLPDAKVEGIAYSSSFLCVATTNEVPNGVLFNGHATWPRRVKKLSNSDPQCLAILARFLKQHHVKQKPEITNLISADLDGDGTQEVIMTTERDMDSAQDNYSAILIRYVKNGKPATYVYDFTPPHATKDPPPLIFRLLSVADYDGDGKMEMVIWRRFHNNRFGSLCRFRKGRLSILLDAGLSD